MASLGIELITPEEGCVREEGEEEEGEEREEGRDGKARMMLGWHVFVSTLVVRVNVTVGLLS
jgi:hypothetical protein